MYPTTGAGAAITMQVRRHRQVVQNTGATCCAEAPKTPRNVAGHPGDPSRGISTPVTDMDGACAAYPTSHPCCRHPCCLGPPNAREFQYQPEAETVAFHVNTSCCHGVQKRDHKLAERPGPHADETGGGGGRVETRGLPSSRTSDVHSEVSVRPTTPSSTDRFVRGSDASSPCTMSVLQRTLVLWNCRCAMRSEDDRVCDQTPQSSSRNQTRVDCPETRHSTAKKWTSTLTTTPSFWHTENKPSLS